MCAQWIVENRLGDVKIGLAENRFGPITTPNFEGCSSDIASSYIFHTSKVTEHVTSQVSADEFRIK